MFCTAREHGGSREGGRCMGEPATKYYWQGCDKDYGPPIKVRKIIKDEQRRDYSRSVSRDVTFYIWLVSEKKYPDVPEFHSLIWKNFATQNFSLW